MNMQVITVAPKEERVLLMFEGEGKSAEDQKVLAYLKDNRLKPKRLYHEQRDGKDYLVYYFGHCYVEGHLPELTAMAKQANS